VKAQEKYMKRCLGLAVKGFGKTGTNPMVGCVIVHKGKIIGEGFHRAYGEAHAEVNAINSVKDKSLLQRSTLYVSLEPCSHFGKTPPCADLIIAKKIPAVVIGAVDSNPIVKAKGIQKLIQAGIDVKTGVLEEECRELNKRFFTYFEKKRPYIILKWAQTADGFIDKRRKPGDNLPPLQVSNSASRRLSHLWRTQEQAIMVGTRTALLDDPQLNVRLGKGRNPLRIMLDKDLVIPANFHLLDDSTPTLVFTAKEKRSSGNIEYVKVPFKNEKASLKAMMRELFKRKVQSLIVEGGSELLNSFIKEELWDEARVFYSGKKIQEGVRAPLLKGHPAEKKMISGNKLFIYRNR
jgi:diaminohydroxyphosphoribosylaminopyrimidine deaminase/5-amino-6-(5-phosphoribosylamino)uracil reductase